MTDAVVLSCIDFRFTPHLHEALAQALSIHKFDLIQLAGGAKNLASPDSEARAQAVLDDLALAIQAHGVHTIVLVNHQQCGKYAQSGVSFKTLDEERSFHAHELTAAAGCVRRAFLTVVVRTGFLTLNNRGDVLLEMIGG